MDTKKLAKEIASELRNKKDGCLICTMDKEKATKHSMHHEVLDDLTPWARDLKRKFRTGIINVFLFGLLLIIFFLAADWQMIRNLWSGK